MGTNGMDEDLNYLRLTVLQTPIVRVRAVTKLLLCPFPFFFLRFCRFHFHQGIPPHQIIFTPRAIL